ncbi:MAG TPA: BON domain-containing protein [Terriglobales bacterium]|nr:BON domain-containing protein [Terriglobales bacterium]
MRYVLGNLVLAIALAVCLPGVCAAQAGSATAANSSTTTQNRQLSPEGVDRIKKEVRHQLVMQPFYSVFDNFEYKVDPDGTVTLMGQVVDPTLKSDAEKSVKHIEGVERVVNDIEVLPVSPNDDRIRRATYRAIYGNDVLNMYALRAVPPIHIIVNGGHVSLDGVVARPMDKQVAEMQAKSVPGVFSVTDNLQVENQNK